MEPLDEFFMDPAPTDPVPTDPPASLTTVPVTAAPSCDLWTQVMGLTTLWWDVVYQRNAEERHEEHNREVAEQSILEMMMLGKANLFVGKATSNFYRTALELKAAACDCMPAFYSLDSPWCPPDTPMVCPRVAL